MFGHEYIRQLVEFQEKIVEEVGKEKLEFPVEEIDLDLETKVREFATDKIRQAVKALEKQVREDHLESTENEVHENFAE